MKKIGCGDKEKSIGGSYLLGSSNVFLKKIAAEDPKQYFSTLRMPHCLVWKMFAERCYSTTKNPFYLIGIIN